MVQQHYTIESTPSVTPPVREISESASVRRLVNHDIMNCTADGVVGNEYYSARALGMTNEQDIIQLSPKLKSEWPYICEHYDRIGLSYTRDVIWSTDLEQCALNPTYLPSVFFFGEDEHRSYKDDAWKGVVNYINSKNNFMELAKILGVPVPQTLCFDRVAEITPIAAGTFQYPCYLKASISVSGVGIYRCETPEALMESAATFAPSTPVQVQEEVVTDCFLNMQYEVTDGWYRRLLTTEQILEGPVHQGNIHPPRTAPWEIVEPMAEWMTRHGFKGVFAFDVAVIETPEETRYLAIECNPRYNGASYPTAIAKKLDIPAWESRYFKTWHKSLSEVDLKGLEYDSETGEGAIIVNWGPIFAGKLMFMLAGNEKVRRQLDIELTKRLW
ncbi:MAG: ATP-grasp domain-containing protein [Sedimenticola sp.]